MRLGKHEKAVLVTLSVFSSVNTQWNWNPRSSTLRALASASDIERFEAGEYVAVAKLRHDLGIRTTVLSRTLKSLHQKALIVLRGGSLDTIDGTYVHNTKYVSLTSAGRRKARLLPESGSPHSALLNVNLIQRTNQVRFNQSKSETNNTDD